MERKKSEGEFGVMMRQLYHYFTYKWRDRGFVECPHCGRMVRNCPYCHRELLLNKAQTYPDFLVAYGWGFYEVKFGKERFGKADITPNQYKVMEKCREGWLFLEMGEGRAPAGRSAFLLPWNVWLGIEVELEKLGVSSIVYERKSARGKSPVANELLAGFAMQWDRGWKIPKEHVFWETHQPLEEAVYETENG